MIGGWVSLIQVPATRSYIPARQTMGASKPTGGEELQGAVTWEQDTEKASCQRRHRDTKRDDVCLVPEHDLDYEC